MRRPSRTSPWARRGNAAVTVLAMVPLLGFGALAVDVGMLQYSHSQLQIGVDAAAIGGAGYLDGTEAGMKRAIEKAITFGGMNQVLGRPLALTSANIKLGAWDKATGRFTSTTDPKKVTAVLVEKDVSDIGTLFASAAFGSYFMDTTAQSVAKGVPTSGTGRVECFLPIAVPSCYLTKEDVQVYPVKFSSAQNDNAGWSEIGANPNTDSIRSQLRGNCTQGEAAVGDMVGLNNGEITAAFQEVQTQIENSTLWWDATRWGPIRPAMNGNATGDGDSKSTIHPLSYGKVIEGPVIVFEPTGGECGSSTQFNQKSPIVGFVWGIVYDVDASGQGKTMRVQLDLTYDHNFGVEGGGLATNILYYEYGLVY